MKILYAGTPQFAVPPLQRLIEAGFEVVGVVTQADKPQGRKGALTPPPVKVLAEEKGLPVLQSERIREELSALSAFGADVMVTCAYGQILTQAVLDLFPKGVWNIHAGLLPAYRGASPIQNCLLNGETETGVSVMKTELGLDSGDILYVQKTPVSPTETYGQLSDRLSLIGAECIVTAMNMVKNGAYTLQKQGENGVNIFRKINKEHAAIDFSKTPNSVVNLVRAMNPAPVAYTAVEGNKVNVYLAEEFPLLDGSPLALAAADAAAGEVLSDSPKQGLIVKCGDGAVKLLEVQAAGGKRMSGGDFLNGRKARKGQVLSC